MSLRPVTTMSSRPTVDTRPHRAGGIRIRNRRAFATGCALLALYFLQDALGLKLPVLESWQTRDAYKITTGVLLLAFILHQWRLPFARARGDARTTKVLYRRHARVGLIAPALLLVHATSLGHGYLSALAGTFLATCALGLTTAEYLDLGSRRFGRSGLIAHVTLSTILLSLVMFHIHVVFYYE